ncbi:uncharacterized protein FOMMEDRAFT_17318 [Fomitiporia mediterranea MF3/22]|uniref:uncharacterized protein n=1 Tax=Fomitiporia mediterranea (strain MF3/22) TaxID=694068 RepID=UPI00044086B0|nr:uncharacterized protein FOMMEDRAFT_17318 [Fomitiporia mediterranea MF3/22]EJD06853.1 hypothetical protein FOMMEDRAFT_17318 [Fomitiporia mediterranea MF3/22]
MYRALPLTRRGTRHAAASLRTKQQRSVRLFSKSPKVADASSSSSASPPKPKKRGFFRTVALYSTGFVLVFYAASPVIAANNERYNVFFSESVPFGERILSAMEDRGIDEKLRFKLLKTGRDKMQKVFDDVSRRAGSGPPAAEKTEQIKGAVVDKVSSVSKSQNMEKAKQKVRDAKEHAQHVAEELKTRTEESVSKVTQKVSEAVVPVGKKPTSTSARPASFSEGIEDLVRRAEGALAGKYVDGLPDATTTPEQPAGSPPDVLQGTPKDVSSDNGKIIYSDLPIGFEPPPGYSRPKPLSPSSSKSEDASKKEEGFPLVAPAVADIGSSEPVISELATTIDSLAAFVKGNPNAASSAKGILDTAKDDLQQLAGRIEGVRSEERRKLEAQLDEQAREYSLKLLELEMTAQDKLDAQEIEFKAFYEDERKKLTRVYREKLEHELRTQSEIINERLKAEVIAQGIEMQRRWIREIKVRVEQERGGRLAKLDELATNLKQLERITLDNAEYLNENLRLHATWAALRALAAASADTPVRRPFRDELRALRHSSGAKEDELVSKVLDSLEKTDVPDVGVEPLADLTTWFTTSVAPQVRRVALVPEHDAGVLSYLASNLISSFRFARHGPVEGNDVLSVLARAEHYINEKDLDSAARELNQLKGAPKVLLSDWLDATRKRLEVLQALEVVQTQTTLASLRVV